MRPRKPTWTPRWRRPSSLKRSWACEAASAGTASPRPTPKSERRTGCHRNWARPASVYEPLKESKKVSNGNDVFRFVAGGDGFSPHQSSDHDVYRRGRSGLVDHGGRAAGDLGGIGQGNYGCAPERRRDQGQGASLDRGGHADWQIRPGAAARYNAAGEADLGQTPYRQR